MTDDDHWFLKRSRIRFRSCSPRWPMHLLVDVYADGIGPDPACFLPDKLRGPNFYPESYVTRNDGGSYDPDDVDCPWCLTVIETLGNSH